ncbi:uncharacterized protein NEMAJ01_0864 [Nematocida major]|uniref:uncharacterized protein n=1 Tax=Nematocida major TaxID=1912982 RepID=UPI00200790A9|nr:uncharacterized protein NEMAJ01_0864 [Nematocida major]KAH9385968.1 hypothetical protein NEMAJ01_0864 [Nematocida major]
MDRKTREILEENERMKTLRRTVLDLKDISQKINTAAQEDVEEMDKMRAQGLRDALTVQNIINKLQTARGDSFTFTFIVTICVLGLLLFLGLLFM